MKTPQGKFLLNFSLENSPLFLYLNLDRNIIIKYQRYEKKVNVVNDSQIYPCCKVI
jgi:hypothetical protein